MPIKFRCQHCQQLLGISQRKAGSVVNCPACGRSIRVPTPEDAAPLMTMPAAAAPAGDPEWDLADSALARALDELAAIGQGGEGAVPLAPLAEPVDASGQPALPPLQRVVLDAPLPAVAQPPVIPYEPGPAPHSSRSPPALPLSAAVSPEDDAPPGREGLDPHDHPPRAEARHYDLPVASRPGFLRSVERDREPSAAGVEVAGGAVGGRAGSADVAERKHRGETASGSWQIFSQEMLAHARSGERGLRRLVLRGGLVLVTMGLVGGAGYLLGRARGPSGEPGESMPTAPQGQAPVAAAVAGRGADRQPAFRGRITYVSSTGDSRPDRGARVLVLPVSRVGTVKLPIIGFRPGDELADLQVAQAALRALGGDLTSVDEDGNYHLGVTGAGEYYVVVLSRHQSREDEAPPAARLRQVLDQYFERPDQLLGKLAYQATALRYRGTGTDVWDQVFPRP